MNTYVDTLVAKGRTKGEIRGKSRFPAFHDRCNIFAVPNSRISDPWGVQSATKIEMSIFLFLPPRCSYGVCALLSSPLYSSLHCVKSSRNTISANTVCLFISFNSIGIQCGSREKYRSLEYKIHERGQSPVKVTEQPGNSSRKCLERGLRIDSNHFRRESSQTFSFLFNPFWTTRKWEFELSGFFHSWDCCNPSERSTFQYELDLFSI